MPTQTGDTFTLSGDDEHRVLEVLKVAKHQVRVAQGGAAPRMQDALVGLENALSDQIAWLENAAEDDKADADDSGEAEPERRAYYPPRAARHDRTSIRFNLINPDTGNRIRMITQDAETGKELERRDLVKGYEFRKNQYLLLNDEDLNSVKVESSAVMTVEKFVDADSIDPVYYAAAYHLAPDGDAGRDIYAVLREAIAKTGKVALSRVVISQRERTIALRPADGGLMAHTLFEERDLNSGQELFECMDGIKVDPEMVELATQLVQRQAGKYDASDLEDRYETRLRALIDAKLKGEGIDAAEEPEIVTSNVVDLMATLRKSLGQVDEEEPAAAKKKAAPKRSAAQAATKPSRKRA